MKELVIFANYKEAQIMTLIMLLVFGVVIETIRYLLVKKVNIISLIINIAIFLVAMFASNVSVILVIILMCLSTFLEILYFLYKVYIELQLKGKTNDYLRNTDYDFFIQMNKKGKIVDCSSSVLKLSKLAKKDIIKNIGWKFIFDHFDVKAINKEEITQAYVTKFLQEYEACNSKHKSYKFTLDVNVNQKDDETKSEIIQYIGIIQPIYCKNFLVARNVYFYQDRLQVVEKLREIVRTACTDLEDAYLQLDMMMSISEGVVMYYDYHNKVYVATDCMRQYTKTEQREYSFDTIYAHIHPDDIPSYLEQAETVNSLSITKIRYRLQIGGIYYNVEEDTIALRKDFGLISIIRIAEKEVIQNAPRNAKIRRDVEELNALVNANIKDTLDKTIDILNVVLGEHNKENEKDN